jgi:protein SCO1/2
LTGSPENIQAIAKAVGFRYKYDRATDQYNHVAAAIAISPQGKITRYIYDVSFDPNTLRLALMEASEGKIGTTVDAFMLWCMTYDGKENRYSADARKLLAIAAGIFTVVLVGASIPFWMKKTPPLGANQLVSKNDQFGGVSPKAVSVEDKDVSVDARVAPVNDLALDEVNEKLCSTSDK